MAKRFLRRMLAAGMLALCLLPGRAEAVSTSATAGVRASAENLLGCTT